MNSNLERNDSLDEAVSELPLTELLKAIRKGYEKPSTMIEHEQYEGRNK